MSENKNTTKRLDAKFEMRPQPGVDAGQAARVTSWITITQVLERAQLLLEALELNAVKEDAGTPQDIKLLEDVKVTAQKWRDFHFAIRDHMNQVGKIYETQLAASRDLVSAVNQAKKLPTDTELSDRLKGVLELLDRLEAHRKSGLLEAVSKL